MQHFLKSASGAGDAEVVAAELFVQFDVAMHDADATLHARFGRIGFATLARDLKRTAGRSGRAQSWSWKPTATFQCLSAGMVPQGVTQRALARLRFFLFNEVEILKRELFMSPFRTAIVHKHEDARRRLTDFELIIEQILAVRDSARAASDDASPLMPQNAPGTLAYIYGVGALRGGILGGNWVIDRTLGVEAIINHELGVRIGYQNVDRACDPIFPPMPRSDKGNGVAHLCRLPLFDFFGVHLETDSDRLPSDDVKDPHSDQVLTYFVMVGEDGSVELSCPVIANKRYADFVERIFVDRPDEDWGSRVESDSDPIEEFDVQVVFKDRAA